MSDLGTALAILRIVKGWNQEELARAAGLRGGTISDYERGKMVPGIGTVKRLLDAAGYAFASIDLAQDFILRLRNESLRPSASMEAEPSSLGREIEEVSTLAGRTVYRIVRLFLSLIRQTGTGSRRDLPGEGGNGVGKAAPDQSHHRDLNSAGGMPMGGTPIDPSRLGA